MTRRTKVVANLDEYWKTSTAPVQKSMAFIVDDAEAENSVIKECLERIEAVYPGYMKVYEMLSNLGCDNDYITAIIKFANEQTGQTILEVVNNKDLLAKLKMALALDMGADDFVEVLSSPSFPADSLALPGTVSTSDV